jgi:hypothetical protein
LASGSDAAQRFSNTNGSKVRHGCARGMSFPIFVKSNSQHRNKQGMRITVKKNLVTILVHDRAGVRPFTPSEKGLKKRADYVNFAVAE